MDNIYIFHWHLTLVYWGEKQPTAPPPHLTLFSPSPAGSGCCAERSHLQPRAPPFCSSGGWIDGRGRHPEVIKGQPLRGAPDARLPAASHPAFSDRQSHRFPVEGLSGSVRRKNRLTRLGKESRGPGLFTSSVPGRPTQPRI